MATVSSSGVVRAKAAGTSTVSCKANGITLGSATVTVSVEPTSSKIDIAKAQKRFRDADLVDPYNGKARRPFGLTYGGEGFSLAHRVTGTPMEAVLPKLGEVP